MYGVCCDFFFEVGLDIHQEFSAIFSAKPFGVEHCGPESMTTDSSALGTRGFSQEHRAQVTTHTTHFNCTDALHKGKTHILSYWCSENICAV